MIQLPAFALLTTCCLVTLARANLQKHAFSDDCSDRHNKDIVCSVRIVNCDAEEDFVPKASKKTQVPSEAHDLRIEPFAKAKARPKGEDYQLSVDISWQTPPENATARLEGFLLEIEHENGLDRTCFLFNVSETNWTTQAIVSSPRFHFSTDSVFKFDQNYDVTLTSLPEMHNYSRSVRKTVAMPHNPGHHSLSNHLAENCTMYSHPYASKWTAGFRHIILHSLARTIQMEFVGAPKQYCFEQYEVRLVDESGLELLHTDIISVDQMKTEVIDNVTVYFGEYNFTNLELEKTYVPSVIPVEKAADGRCLCPVDGTDPYDNKVICSCVAAEGKPVQLQRVSLETVPTPESNVTIAATDDNNDATISAFYVILALLCFVAFIFVLHVIRLLYIRYRASGKMVRIRFVQDRNSENCAGRNSLLHANGVSATPLILTSKLNILIIYSHDCPQHDAAVLALAEYLRDVFNFEVHLDQWDQKAIESNLMDYISAAVINADKVLIVNSIGSSHRYHSKIMNNGYVVKRAQPDVLDHLFLTQIDQALQHPFMIAIRFNYSSFNDVIPSLHGCLQYTVPEHLTPLLSAIVGCSLRHDSRLADYNPQLLRLHTAISQMEQLRRSEPNWFDLSHVRVLTSTSPRKLVKPQELHTESLPVVVSPKVESEPEEITVRDGVTRPLLTEDSAIQSENGSMELEADAVLPESSFSGEQSAGHTMTQDSAVFDSGNQQVTVDSTDADRIAEQHGGAGNNFYYNATKLDEVDPESSGDSGLVSDMDIRMISAS